MVVMKDNISNPKKVVICSYEMDGTNQICVLTTDNSVYSADFSYDYEGTDKFTDALNNLNCINIVKRCLCYHLADGTMFDG